MEVKGSNISGLVLTIIIMASIVMRARFKTGQYGQWIMFPGS